MALFIPEWIRVSGPQLQLRRMLGGLDDEYVVRTPLRSLPERPDFYVQHPRQGWLAVAREPAPFAALDPAQLFDTPERSRFEQRLAALQALEARAGVPVLMLMEACSIEETRTLTRTWLPLRGVRLMA